jgi:hypothetical protein
MENEPLFGANLIDCPDNVCLDVSTNLNYS